MDVDGSKRVYQRLGVQSNGNRQRKVCFHWKAGRCNRYPCPYLHTQLPTPHLKGTSSPKKPHGFAVDNQQRNPNFNNSSTCGRGGGGGVVKKKEKLCKFWAQGNCKHGDRCKFLHSWSTADCFSLLTKLEGHQNVVSGIALPSGSDMLYTGSKDETVRIWDWQSGQCSGVCSVAGEVGCMLSEGPWVFVGLPNVVKAWNARTETDLSLGGPVGQVYALVVGNDLLFAGTQDGTILAWKFKVVSNGFETVASLKGHTLTVTTLVVGANRLYSGSMDNSIRVWSLETLHCVQTLTGHASVVMSLLCWDQFLISCSLDKTIKMWVAKESGNLEVTYTHTEEVGLLTLCEMHDAEAKPVLLCACNDNSVRVYDLPVFSQRGKVLSKQEVRSIQIGPAGLFFTGDGTGEVRVWKLLADSTANVCQM